MRGRWEAFSPSVYSGPKPQPGGPLGPSSLAARAGRFLKDPSQGEHRPRNLDPNFTAQRFPPREEDTRERGRERCPSCTSHLLSATLTTPPFFKFTCNGNYPKHTPCQWNGRPGTEAKALKFVQNTSYFYQDLKECKALR